MRDVPCHDARMSTSASTDTDPRIGLARELFAAWSSGNPDAPEPLLASDAVLSDIVGGTHHGWPAIRAFFARGLEIWPDLVLEPERYWVNEDGVALSWVMSATVTDAVAPRFGAGNVGRRWRSEGMSWLDIVDGRVRREVDYHDGGAPVRSLQSAAPEAGS